MFAFIPYPRLRIQMGSFNPLCSLCPFPPFHSSWWKSFLCHSSCQTETPLSLSFPPISNPFSKIPCLPSLKHPPRHSRWDVFRCVIASTKIFLAAVSRRNAAPSMGASLYRGESWTLKLVCVLFPGNGQLEKRQGVLCREFLTRNHFLLPFKTALCEMLCKSITRDCLTLGHLQDKETRQE